jgi:Zn-dependent peptidase ImmA (M78 family)
MKLPTILARKLLQESGVINPPVDLAKIARDHGITVKETDLPEDVAGMIQMEGLAAAIYIKKTDTKGRKRFTLAHELGHYFLKHFTGTHVDRGPNYAPMVFMRNDDSSKALYQPEIAANKFAAELLMPERMVHRQLDEVVALCRTEEDIIKIMSERFIVSELAMTHRLNNLGIRFS